MMRGVGHVAYMGPTRNSCNILFIKYDEKRQFGRAGHVWEDNIKAHLREMTN